jgi:hypothetical protein
VARRNTESRDFATALVVTCLIVAAFFAYSYWYAPGKPASHANEQRRSTATAPPVIATVYECNDANGRVLSDRPCGGDARVREVVQPNLMPGSGDAKSEQPAANRERRTR